MLGAWSIKKIQVSWPEKSILAKNTLKNTKIMCLKSNIRCLEFRFHSQINGYFAEFNWLSSSIIFINMVFVLLIEVEATINVLFTCQFLHFYCFSKSY